MAKRGRVRSRVVAIGASTGGTAALEVLLPQLGPEFPAPILIVQHLPAAFTQLFAERLGAITHMPVHELRSGMQLADGAVIIAAGGGHMRVERDGLIVRAQFDQGPPENSCRPAADVLFRSVAEVFGPEALAVVLTGAGCDGTAGCLQIRAGGGQVLAQDEASSAAWGMPGSAVRAGAVDAVHDLLELPQQILQRVRDSQ